MDTRTARNRGSVHKSSRVFGYVRKLAAGIFCTQKARFLALFDKVYFLIHRLRGSGVI